MKKASKKKIAPKGEILKKKSTNKAAPKKVAAKKKIALKGVISKKKSTSKAAHKRVAGKKKIALKGQISQKNSTSKAAPKKVAGKKKMVPMGEISRKKSASKAANKKVAGKKSKITRPRPIRETSEPEETLRFSAKGPSAREGGQSGDLQGLSNLETAGSESVVELLEEGNAFEAAVVAGVQNDGNEPSEVRTHEVLEDDVPPEYLDRE